MIRDNYWREKMDMEESWERAKIEANKEELAKRRECINLEKERQIQPKKTKDKEKSIKRIKKNISPYDHDPSNNFICDIGKLGRTGSKFRDYEC